MTTSGEVYVGIDTAKARNAVAVAEDGPDGEVRYLGEFDNADSDDCGQRFRLKPDADSNRRQTVIPMIPDGVVVDVGYGVR
jgi:hypothetical protein